MRRTVRRRPASCRRRHDPIYRTDVISNADGGDEVVEGVVEAGADIVQVRPLGLV
jgi:hypothetical protein